MVSVRMEFTRHLEQEYPNLSFQVGMPKIDILYEKYYVKVTSKDDNITFGVFKSFHNGYVQNDYKSRKDNLINKERLERIFRDSVISEYIRYISGSAKYLTENGGSYQQIYFTLQNEAKHEFVMKKSLEILAENNISADFIIYSFELEQHLYNAHLYPEDMNLTESELKAKIVRIK